MENHPINKDLIIPGQTSLNTVCELINNISCSNDLEPLRKILGEISAYIRTDGILLYRYDKKHNKRTLVSNYFNTKVNLQDFIKKDEIQLPNLRKLFLTNKITKVENLNQLPENASYEKSFLRKVNINSLIMLPFMAETEFYGVFAFSSASQRWEDEVVTYLNLIGKVLSNALTRLKLFSKMSKFQKDFKLLRIILLAWKNGDLPKESYYMYLRVAKG